MKTITPTKNRILRVAQKILSNEGYVGTSISNIAKIVGVTKPTVYHFFKNKEELFKEVLITAFNELNTKLKKANSKKESLDQKLEKLSIIYIKFGLKHKNIFTTALQKIPHSEKNLIHLVTELRKKIITYFEEVIEEGITKNLIPTNNSILTAYLLVGGLDSFLLEKIFFQEKRWTPKSATEVLTSIIFRK
ncbi:TetR/AcrR family transcriptional regulator [Candidatus Gracilibacteria bacterium]|nr:TetR/AcrR family transcriptional regulator [Candidatus Gracilibacteria bacterium]